MNEQLAGLTPAQRDALRLTGVVMFATGATALFLRKAAQDQWAAFPKLLVLAIPCALLYGLGIGAIRLGRPDGEAARDDHVPSWRAGALVFGLLLVPLALSQLVDTLGGDPNKAGHVAWVFLLTAGAGFYAAFGRGLRWGALLGGLALIVSWMAFWDAVVDPSSTAVRLLFLVIGAILAVGAVRLHRDERREAPELVTAAGIAGVGAGVTGLLNIVSGLIGTSLTSAFGGEASVSGAQQRQEWDVFLLLLALALIWYGLRAVWRGPVYVGAFALLAFTISVGYEVTGLFAGDGPSGDVVGWPLLLLLLGGLGLAAGLYGGSGPGSPPEPAAPTTPSRPDPPAGQT